MGRGVSRGSFLLGGSGAQCGAQVWSGANRAAQQVRAQSSGTGLVPGMSLPSRSMRGSQMSDGGGAAVGVRGRPARSAGRAALFLLTGVSAHLVSDGEQLGPSCRLAGSDITGGRSGVQQPSGVTGQGSVGDREDAPLFEGELEDGSEDESVEVPASKESVAMAHGGPLPRPPGKRLGDQPSSSSVCVPGGTSAGGVHGVSVLEVGGCWILGGQGPACRIWPSYWRV